MVANGGMINCSRKCHNIKLSMGAYVLTSPMISIPMRGVDVVLGFQWLQSLGTIAFNFQEIFMKFFVEGKEVELRGIARNKGCNCTIMFARCFHIGIIYFSRSTKSLG